MQALIERIQPDPDGKGILKNSIAAPATGTTALTASDDEKAVSVWLAARATRSQHTLDSYKRDARRLLLWLGENGLTLRSMKVEHAHSFYTHLCSPPAHWIRPRKPRRGEVLLPTQTLFDPLSAQSLAHTRTVLGQLFSYLQDAGYLQRNVFHLSARPAIVVRPPTDRALDFDSWAYLWQWVSGMTGRTSQAVKYAARARWVFALFYHTGMRLNEVARGKMQDFVRANGLWHLKVIGKGSKVRDVTVNSELLFELKRYRISLGLNGLPSAVEDAPLVAPLRLQAGRQGLTARAVALIATTVAERAAGDCEDDQIRRRIAEMTAHWLRHTNATHRYQAGASLETTQDELGHQDPKTTRIYAKTNNSQRRIDAELLAKLK